MTADESRAERDDLDHTDPVTTATDAVPEAGASAGRAHWGLFVAIAVAVVVVDQLTKAWLTSRLAPGSARRRDSRDWGAWPAVSRRRRRHRPLHP